MWNYNDTSQSRELLHYGVPGMKWGVRRDRGASARTAARFKNEYGSAMRKNAKLESSFEKRKSSYKSTARLEQKIAANKARIKGLAPLMKRYTKGLTREEIQQGERQVNSVLKKIAGFALGAAGGLLEATQATGDLVRANRHVKRVSSKNGN